MSKKLSLVLVFSVSELLAYLVNAKGEIVSASKQTLQSVHSKQEWVEYDPKAVIYGSHLVISKVLEVAGCTADAVSVVGVMSAANTSVAWHAKTGEVYGGIIGTACERTYPLSRKWRSIERMIRERTGARFDYRGGAARYYWILQQYFNGELPPPGVKFGSVASWLICQLSGGKSVVTDYSHAQSTGLFNIHTGTWDNDLLLEFGLTQQSLPSLHAHFGSFGTVSGFLPLSDGTPILGCCTEAFGALLSGDCLEHGDCFIETQPSEFRIHVNMGGAFVSSRNGTNVWMTTLGSQAHYLAVEVLKIPNGRYMTVPFTIDSLLEQRLDWVDSHGIVAVSADASPWEAHTPLTIHFFNSRPDQDQTHIQSALLEFIAFSLKMRIQYLEATFGVVIKRLCVGGAWRKIPGFMICMADRLQLPVLTVGSDYFRIQRFGLELLVRTGRVSVIPKSFFKSQFDHHFLPSLDPISVLAQFNFWQGFSDRAVS